MKTKFFVFLLLIVAILGMTASCQQSIDKAIVGAWCVTEESEDVDRDFYPEGDFLVFYDDGTFSEKLSGVGRKYTSYKISGDILIMDSEKWVCQYTYTVKIDNDILTIQYGQEEPLIFERYEKS